MSPVRGAGARADTQQDQVCVGHRSIRGAALQHRALTGQAAHERLCAAQSKLHFHLPLEGLQEPSSVQAGAAEALALPAQLTEFWE